MRALHPVVSVIDSLHRDVAVADDARAGRFTHAGTTLDLGRRPDWLGGGLADDEEWRIEWVKLYEGLDLAHAYRTTGDDDHLAAWEDLVDAFLDQVPVGHDTNDVDARRVQNWIYAWQRFAAVPGFPGLRDGLGERVVDRLRADAAHIEANLTAERNHRTLEIYALLVVGIALGDDGLAQRALGLMADNAEHDIGDDGVQCERSTDYHLIVLRSLIGAIDNGRASGLDVPLRLVERADLAATFALHVQRPDGTTPALSDGDQGDFRALLADAARVLDRPDLLWAASTGAAGRAPRARAMSFVPGGYAVQRSGWGDGVRAYLDERWAVLDCGPLGAGGHGHYDHLSVELMGGGRRLVVDPGRYTYADTPWRQWFKGTAAHNTVTVDGLDQQPYRRGKPKGPQSSAVLVNRRAAGARPGQPALDVVTARATSPRYDAVHTRSLMLVGGDHWIVIDRLDAPTEHEYVARWHLDPEAHRRTVLSHETHRSVVRFPAGTIAVPAGDDLHLEPGWVSPEYGVRVPAPVLAVRHRAASSLFVAVVTPGDRAPRAVRIDAAADGTGGSMLVVDWDVHVDRVFLRSDGADLERVR